MGRISRVVVLGGRGSGKTSILERAIYANLNIDKPYTPTIEDTYVSLVETDRGTKEKLRFYDTAGLDATNRFLPSHCHAVADAYIVVYSVTDNLSFQLLVDIKKDIDRNKEKKDVPIIVLGNKADLANNRVVDRMTAERWSDNERVRHYETTVHSRNSLIEPLVYLSTRLNPQPSKTSFPQLSMGRKNKD